MGKNANARQAWRNYIYPLLGCILLVVGIFYCQDLFLDTLLKIYKPHFSTRHAGSSLAACLTLWTCYTLATVFCLWFVTRFIDTATPVWTLLKARGKASGIAAGFAGGSVLYLVFIGFVSLAGWYRILGIRAHFWGATDFADGMLTGFNEELLFRGYVLQTLARRWGIVKAIAVSSLLFGLVHLLDMNHAEPWQDDIRRVISTSASGIVYALCFLWKRKLWLPIGVHGAWDVMTGIFFQNDGFRMRPLFDLRLSGDSILWAEMWYNVVVAAVCCLLAGRVARRREARQSVGSRAPA